MNEKAVAVDANPSPPYTSATAIRGFFDAITTMKDPKKIDSDWAEANNLEPKLPSSIPTMLRWLGVTNDKNETTDPALWNDLRIPASRPAALARLVQAAYAPIFDALELDAPRAQIDAEFIRKYPSLGDPGRNVKCFLTLCEFADIPIAAAKRKATGTTDKPKLRDAAKPRDKPPNQKRPAGQSKEKGTPKAAGVAVQVNINAEIPAAWTKEQIRERMATIAEAVKESGLQ